MAISPTRRVSSTTTSEPQKKVKPVRAGGAESNDFVEAVDAANRVGVHSNLEYDRERKKKQQEEAQHHHEVLTSGVYVRSAIEALAASGVYEESSEKDHAAAKRNVSRYSDNQSMVPKEELSSKRKSEEDEFFDYFSEFEEEETAMDILIEEINKFI